jgi:hypothetical protein
MAGRHTTHKPGLPVCCEQALKSAGERNTHGGCRCGDLRETARAEEVQEALLDIEGGDLAAGVIPCWRIVDRKYRLASRVAGTKSASRLLADLHLNIKYKMLYCHRRAQ